MLASQPSTNYSETRSVYGHFSNFDPTLALGWRYNVGYPTICQPFQVIGWLVNIGPTLANCQKLCLPWWTLYWNISNHRMIKGWQKVAKSWPKDWQIVGKKNVGPTSPKCWANVSPLLAKGWADVGPTSAQCWPNVGQNNVGPML